MSKYINADRLISMLEAKADMALGKPKKVYHYVVKMVNVLPAADVVEVIRCRDCRYYNRRWGCRKLEINVSADNYCFMAEPAVAEVTFSLSDKMVLENLAKGSDTDNFIRTVMERQLMRMEDQRIRCKDCGYYIVGGFCRKHEIKTIKQNYCDSAKLAVSNNEVVPDEK